MRLLGMAFRLVCAWLVTIPAESAERAPPPLSLAQALQRALAENPRLTAAERDVGIATGLRVQAGALPNPDLSFELDNALGSGAAGGRDYPATQSTRRTRRQARGAPDGRRGRYRNGGLATAGDPLGGTLG
jgi:outer membrane protein TolC